MSVYADNANHISYFRQQDIYMGQKSTMKTKSRYLPCISFIFLLVSVKKHLFHISVDGVFPGQDWSRPSSFGNWSLLQPYPHVNTGFRFGCPQVVQLQTEGAVNHSEETNKKFIKSPSLMALKGQPHPASWKCSGYS